MNVLMNSLLKDRVRIELYSLKFDHLALI